MKVLRKSPSGDIHITMKNTSAKRVFSDLQAKEKINTDLRESKKKKKAEGITTSDATFTTYDQGTYYTCHAEVTPDGGPHDWYLINWYTGVYTYIGTSSDYYIDFNFQKPSLYGHYRLWAEGTMGSGYTGYEYLGDPYIGVTISSGIMTFTDQTAYRNLKARLTSAYDNHQTHLDAYDTMSDAAANAQAITDGFDEFLPYEEFEAHFGFSSLRAQIRSEVLYWQTIDNEYVTYPEDNYPPFEYAQQALMNTQGQIEIGGVGEGPTSLDLTAGRKRPSNYTSSTCMTDANSDGSMIIGTNRKLKLDVYINPQDEDDNDVTTFVGRSRTMNKFLGVWKDVMERQKVSVSGTHYIACSSPTSFDSDYTNPGNKRKYSQTVAFPVGPGRSSKEGEVTTSAITSDYSSTPWTETYHH